MSTAVLATHEPHNFTVQQTQSGDPILKGRPVRAPHCALTGECSMDSGANPGDSAPGDGTTTQPVERKDPGNGSSGSGGSGNDTNSTSPEFNSLMNTLNTLAAAGSPVSPYLQNPGDPTVVPTQSTGSKMSSMVIVLFIIAGALGYYYYRKHGGASLHEAL